LEVAADEELELILVLTLTRVATVGKAVSVAATVAVFMSAWLKIPHNPNVPATEAAATINFKGLEMNSFFL
jgi:hypothetical protein